MVDKKKREYPSLRSWFLACIAGTPVVGFTVFYCIFHFGLHVSIALLIKPFIIVAMLNLLLAPGLYWSRKQYVIRGDQHKRLYLIIAAYSETVCFLYIYFAIRIGLLPSDRALSYYVVIGVFIPFSCIFGFFLHRAIFGRERAGSQPARFRD